MSDTPERNARQALLAAIERACHARGEAQWTSGYRAGRNAACSIHTKEFTELFVKEQGQFKRCDVVDRQVSRAIADYARAVRAEQQARKR